MGGKNYRDLIAWQRAMDLVVLVYEVTKRFPKEEIYGLVSQLRRAVVSIPSNIAEGQGRKTKREFVQFLSIAHGSLREVETQVLIAERIGYVDPKQVEDIMACTGEIGRLINGLSNALSK